MKKPSKRFSLAYIVVTHLALLLGPSVLQAQERKDTTKVVQDTLVYRLRGFIVEAARPSIVGGGASAVEVRLDSLVRRPSPLLAEILRELPLVRVRQNSRGEMQPSLRGMEEREIAVLVDGVPITVGWDNRTDLSVVPLAGATHLTIVRGLSSVLAGPNALGGVLEVGMATDRLPIAEPPPFRIRTGVEHTGALSLSGEAARLWANDEHDRGFLLRYGAGYRRSDGVALADGLPSVAKEDGLLLNSDREYLNGFVSGRWESGPGKSWVGSRTPLLAHSQPLALRDRAVGGIGLAEQSAG
jgi:iron complex outermembrane receptor protein